MPVVALAKTLDSTEDSQGRPGSCVLGNGNAADHGRRMEAPSSYLPAAGAWTEKRRLSRPSLWTGAAHTCCNAMHLFCLASSICGWLLRTARSGISSHFAPFPTARVKPHVVQNCHGLQRADVGALHAMIYMIVPRGRQASDVREYGKLRSAAAPSRNAIWGQLRGTIHNWVVVFCFICDV